MANINIVVDEEFKKEVKKHVIETNETITDCVIRLLRKDMNKNGRNMEASN